MQASRDKGETQLLFGVMVPVIIICWMLFDLWAGCIFLPGPKGRRLPLEANTDAAIFCGFVAAKLGGALALWAWHWLANQPKFDSYTPSIQVASICILAAGLLAIVVHTLLIFTEVFPP